MDDGSTDGTPTLLEDYARRHPAERFRWVRHENMGQARTLNRGYDMARGEILGYLSDDDLLAPSAVSRLVAELVANPDVVAAYPGYRMIDADGEIIDTIRPIEYSPVEAWRLHDTIIGPGGLVRRTVLESIGGWDTSLHWMGDLTLWMKVGLAGRIVRLPGPLASWRRHPGGITLQVGIEHAREHVRLVEEGASLLGSSALGREAHAEALRNACIIASFFGGTAETAPGDRFAAIDLQRPQISAFGAGLEPSATLDDRADHVASLWRELGVLTTEIGERRAEATGRGSPGGLDAALDRLRLVGAIAADGATSGASDRELRIALMEAAVDCGADIDPRTSRYLLVDRRQGIVREDELAQLSGLAMSNSSEQLRSLVASRRREWDSLQGRAATR
jgi:hypothetical protein